MPKTIRKQVSTSKSRVDAVEAPPRPLEVPKKKAPESNEGRSTFRKGQKAKVALSFRGAQHVPLPQRPESPSIKTFEQFSGVTVTDLDGDGKATPADHYSRTQVVGQILLYGSTPIVTHEKSSYDEALRRFDEGVAQSVDPDSKLYSLLVEAKGDRAVRERWSTYSYEGHLPRGVAERLLKKLSPKGSLTATLLHAPDGSEGPRRDGGFTYFDYLIRGKPKEVAAFVAAMNLAAEQHWKMPTGKQLAALKP